MRQFTIHDFPVTERFWPTPTQSLKHGPTLLTLPKDGVLSLASARWDDTSLTCWFTDHHVLELAANNRYQVEPKFSFRPALSIVDSEDDLDGLVLIKGKHGDWEMDRSAMIQHRIGQRLLSVSVSSSSVQLLFTKCPPLLLSACENLETRSVALIWFDLT